MPALPRSLALFCALFVTCVCAGVQADERSAAQRFEAAKTDEPSLIAFLKTMPKGGDLHVHVGGAAYAEYALDNAIRQKLFYDPAANLFMTQAAPTAPNSYPAADLLKGQHSDALAKFLDAASMRGVHPDSESGHDHFFDAFSFVDSAQTGMSTLDVNVEVIARALSQNEQYIELMTRAAPDDAYALLQNPPALPASFTAADMETALTTLAPKLTDFVAKARLYLDANDVEMAQQIKKAQQGHGPDVTPPITGTQGPITLRYIMTTNRLKADADFFASIAAGMAVMQADRRVAGINILAPEDHPFARTHFAAQMQMLDFLWKHYQHPNITLHAGELTLAFSPPEPMRSRIRASIEVGHARRIGHGISIAWEDDLPGLLREMRAQGVAVEICLTSNAGILGVQGDHHPFTLYRKAGIPITLNTDDEAINRSTLTMEFVRAVRAYNLAYSDVKTFARNSIAYSFLPGDSLFLDTRYRKLRPEFSGIARPGWKPSPEAQRLLNTSEKMQVQARLEQAFATFENEPREAVSVSGD